MATTLQEIKRDVAYCLDWLKQEGLEVDDRIRFAVSGIRDNGLRRTQFENYGELQTVAWRLYELAVYTDHLVKGIKRVESERMKEQRRQSSKRAKKKKKSP